MKNYSGLYLLIYILRLVSAQTWRYHTDQLELCHLCVHTVVVKWSVYLTCACILYRVVVVCMVTSTCLHQLTCWADLLLLKLSRAIGFTEHILGTVKDNANTQTWEIIQLLGHACVGYENKRSPAGGGGEHYECVDMRVELFLTQANVFSLFLQSL